MATHTLDWNEVPPDGCRSGVLSIGNFDGVHRGHSLLMAELRRQSAVMSGPAVALTFDPHPLQLLRPQQFQPLLTTIEERATLLQRQGAEHVIILRTTPELLHLTAEAFFQEVIETRLVARGLVEGTNFGFGRNREGTIETLRALCRQQELGLLVVAPLMHEGIPVSSSRVRAALQRGAVREAVQLLGRPYRLLGTVGTGQRRGQALGFPTANLEQVPTLIPGDGVYAVRAFHNDRAWPGAANIGPNPTFADQAHKLEVHLIGYQGDLYGQRLGVEFLERMRETRPFAGVSLLVEQLRVDIEQARRIVDSLPSDGRNS